MSDHPDPHRLPDGGYRDDADHIDSCDDLDDHPLDQLDDGETP